MPHRCSPPSRIDGTSASWRVMGIYKRRILAWLMDRLGGLVVIAPARIVGDPGTNSGPGENFFS